MTPGNWFTSYRYASIITLIRVTGLRFKYIIRYKHSMLTHAIWLHKENSDYTVPTASSWVLCDETRFTIHIHKQYTLSVSPDWLLIRSRDPIQGLHWQIKCSKYNIMYNMTQSCQELHACNVIS